MTVAAATAAEVMAAEATVEAAPEAVMAVARMVEAKWWWCWRWC